MAFEKSVSPEMIDSERQINWPFRNSAGTGASFRLNQSIKGHHHMQDHVEIGH